MDESAKNLFRAAELFERASQLEGSAREAFLDENCGDNRELRNLLHRMLRAKAGQGSFLGNPEANAPSQSDQPSQGELSTLKDTRIRERAGDLIGPYKLLERIGEGGFGEVWVAEQQRPVRRKVALKIVKAGMDTREVLARFEAERQALAVMDHPNVARVFDAGETPTGRPYFVMEHVPGLPITAYCDSSRLKIRERLNLFIDICNAVQHAHQKGIIHRDLKPANILVTLQDGKPVAKVIDFGIAKATIGRLTDRTLYTETGRLIGTPEYMSPEQAGTTGLDIDTRADIYSLGVLLYQLLTGTLPFDAATLRGAGFDGIAKIIREQDPPKPSTRLLTIATEPVTRREIPSPAQGEGRPEGDSLPEPERIARAHNTDIRTLQKYLRGDLDWITMKAMEKDRARRYETASAFAADVGRHLSGEAVVAAPPAMGYRVRKFARKHRGRVIAAAFTASSLLGGSITTCYQMLKADKKAAEAVVAKHRAEQLRDEAEWGAYIANIALAQSAIMSMDWPQARRRLECCPESKRGWEHSYLQELSDSCLWSSPTADGAAFSADGTKVLTWAGDTVQVMEASTGHHISRTFRVGSTVECGAITADGLNAIIACDNSSGGVNLEAWNTAEGKQVTPPQAANISLCKSLVLSPDGARLMATRGNFFFGYAKLLLWEMRNGLPAGPPLTVRGEWNGLAFSPNGKLIAAFGWPHEPHGVDGTVLQMFDAQSALPVGSELVLGGGQVQDAAFDSNGTILFASVDDGSVRSWSVPSGAPISVSNVVADYTSSTWSFGGHWEIRCISATSGRLMVRHEHASFCPNEFTCYKVFDFIGNTLGTNVLPILWEPSPLGSEVATFDPGGNLILAGSGAGRGVAVFAADRFDSPHRFAVGSTEDGELEYEAALGGPLTGCQTVKTTKGAHGEFGAMLLDGQAQQFVRLDGLQSTNGECTISPDGSRAVMATTENALQIWETKGGREVARFSLQSRAQRPLFSSDGTRLLVFEAVSDELFDARPFAVRQADRNTRFAERLLARSYIADRLAGTAPKDELEHQIRSDKSASPTRRLVRLAELRQQLGNISTKAGEAFDKLRSDHVLPPHLALAAEREPLAPRIKSKLMQIVGSFVPSADLLNTWAWETAIAQHGGAARLQEAYEAASEADRLRVDDPLILRTLGLVEYRRAHFENALKLLNRSEDCFRANGLQDHHLHFSYQITKDERGRTRIGWIPQDGINWAVIAMCDFKQGAQKRARDSLKTAYQLVASAVESKAGDRKEEGTDTFNTNGRIRDQLIREAELTINGATAGTAPPASTATSLPASQHSSVPSSAERH